MSTLKRVALGGGFVGLVLALPAPIEAGPPALLAEARYVALGYDHGGGFVSETDVSADVLVEEREALQRIRSGLEQWGRYSVVVRPAQADLLIAIRKGRTASFGGGISVGGPPSGRAGAGPVGIGPLAGAEVSSPDDMIEVFERSGSLVWRGMKANGLAGAGPPLWESFQAEVARAEKRAKKP
jgi:hypothetical protein